MLRYMYRNGNCKRVIGGQCDIGLRTRLYYVLSGSVLSVWSLVESALNAISPANASKMQIVRLKLGDGKKIVGE